MPERFKNFPRFKYIAFLLFLLVSVFAEAQLTATNNQNFSNISVTACGTNVYKVTAYQANANQQGRLMIKWNGTAIGKTCYNCFGWGINQVYPDNNNGTIAVGSHAGRWWYFNINTSNETAYGYTTEFACDAAPTVTTDVGSITCNSASFEGDVTDGGTATVTERGFIHGTNNTDVSNAQYGSLGSASLLTVGSGNGTFSSARTGLSSGTTYYLKSYAINSVGTSYGSVESFTPSFTIASTASASRLGAGTLAISATTNRGTGDVRWYDVPSGGSALPNTSASGADWTTPSITETVTYYAEAYIGSCTSPRVASIATVNYAPGGVSNNLLLWLKADVGVTGTDPVTGWADQSGNGFNAVVGGNGPRLVTNSMNFQPTINFDHDNNEWMKITDGIFGNNTKTTMFAYVVIKMPSVTSPYHLNAVFGQKLRGNSSNNWSKRDFLFLPVWGTTSYWQLGNNVIDNNSGARIQVNSSNAGVVVDKPQLWSLGSHSTTSTPEGKKKYINFNGAHVTSQNWYNSTAQGQTGDANYDFRIGNWQRSSGNMFHGDIAEIVIYDGVPSATEENKIQTYLATKYGITLNGINYLNSDGNSVWTDDVTYDDDIAVMGRDDASGINQKQAKSNTTKAAITISTTTIAASNADNNTKLGTDKSFIVWGNNGVAPSIIDDDLDSRFDKRLSTEWLVTESGTVGDVVVEVDLTGLEAFPNPSADKFGLVIDDNGTFNEGSPDVIPASSFADNKLTFNAVDFTTGKYFTIMNGATVLPVELAYFEGKRVGSYVLLEWETMAEVNNDYFIVEKSTDGENWEEILTVDGQGNTSEQTYYSQIDIDGCEGICYYRLKQFDFDGQSEESKIIVLESENKNQEFKISVSPNPVNQMANIAFTAPESGMFSLTVTTQTGQVMYTAKTIGDKGNNHISYNASMLTSGSYYFILEDKNGKRTQQLVIK